MTEPITSLAAPLSLAHQGDKRRDVLPLLHDPAWQQRSTREMAKHCGVNHAYVIKLRRGLAGNVTSVALPQTKRDATPQTSMLLLTGEVLAGCGVSPGLAQRIRTRLATMPPAQRREAERLLGELLL
jgi:hypothetical protein